MSKGNVFVSVDCDSEVLVANLCGVSEVYAENCCKAACSPSIPQAGCV